MKYILCYGDSNTWGCAPEVFTRYEYSERWPGVMQNILGSGYHVYEDALNGRTTVFEDPIEEGRCGKEGFPVALMSNAPLDLVIIMLGCNDVKLRFKKEPWDIAWGVDLLIQYIKKANCGRDGAMPKVLIVAPPHFGTNWSETRLGTVFDLSCGEKLKQLAGPYSHVAKINGCDFIDVGTAVKPGSDCVHLTKEGHNTLGEIFAKKVIEIL